ncbi:CBS domain-containing protein [Halobacteria archaeon HArc-gm2]|nr:CBS domain-containing protein [Halobacteria archaeon HArc-gm2]
MLVPTPVREIMRSPVERISPEAAVVEAAERLRDGDVGSLVVVHGGEPVGIITESDVVAVAAARGDTDALTVGDVMSEDLVTVDPDATVEAAVESLRAHDVEKLPVLEDGALVGIVTTTDVADYVPRGTWTAGEHAPVQKRHRFTRPDTAYEDEEWDFESYGTEDGIDVGDHVTFTKTLAESDVRAFAEASGDTNRLHLDAEYAEETRFGRRIVHGTLVAGLISAALARLPGLTIYLSQEVSYRGPVDLNERVTARCDVVEALGERRFRLTTAVEDADGETVVDGQAVVLSDPHPEGV